MRRPRFLAAALLLLAAAPRPAAADDVPKIRSVNPTSALRGQTTDVAIEGSNLFPFDEITTTRKEVSVTPLQGGDAHKVTVRVVVPDTAAPGSVPITLKTKTGVATTDRFTVRLRSPSVARVRPDTVQRGTEVDLVLTGTNLAFLGQDTKLTVEAPLTAAVTGKPSDKSLTVHLVVPASVPPGPKSLQLETTDGRVSTTFVVALAPPEVTGITPTTIARGASAEVKLAGKNLGGAPLPLLAIPDGGIAIAAAGAPQAGLVPLKVTVAPDAVPGPRLLVVTTADGLAVARFDVTTPVPRIVSVKPAGAARGASADLDVALENAPGPWLLRVFPPDGGVSVEMTKAGRPRVTVAPDALAGARTLVLEHRFGLSAVPFTVNLRGPSVTALAPAEVAPGAQADVAIEGDALAGAAVTLATEDPKVVVTPGPKAGTVHVSVAADAKPGPRSLLVRTPDGAATAVLSVAGPATSAPGVGSIVPLRAPRGAATEIVVKGANLRATGDRPPEVSLSIDGTAVPTKIKASTPSVLTLEVTPAAGTPLGGATLVVRTPEGAAAGVVAVVPAAPTIASVEPARISRPGDTTVVVKGAYLTGPDGKAPVVTLSRPDGSGPLPVRVAAATPDALTLTCSPDAAAPTGAYVLSLRTPDGGGAVPFLVEPAPPEIQSIEPITIGSPATVSFTVKGRHLTGPGGKQPKVAVTRLGSAASVDPQVLSAEEGTLTVRVTTPRGTPPGPHVVVVTTADGSSAALFRVVDAPMPLVTGIEPAVGARLSTVTVVLKGTGLMGATRMDVSGTGVTAQIVPGGTDTDVTVRITVDKDAAPGPRTFTVTAPGGVAPSGSLGFTVK